MKNLIYFTIFGDANYLDMIELCLKSMRLSCRNISFDFLFITQEDFKEKIHSFIKDFKNESFFIIKEKIDDPMQASMRKLDIFEFDKISNYQKVLFLDCDILILKDIDELFKEPWPNDLLSVFAAKDCVKNFNSKFHGLTNNISEEKLKILNDKGIWPFNAGHFAFINSDKMRRHFENVIWLSKIWPGEYFYEQSFMNYYFALNQFVDYSLFRNKIFLANLRKITKFEDCELDTIYIIHFIGSCEITNNKFTKIKYFFDANFKTI